MTIRCATDPVRTRRAPPPAPRARRGSRRTRRSRAGVEAAKRLEHHVTPLCGSASRRRRRSSGLRPGTRQAVRRCPRRAAARYGSRSSVHRRATRSSAARPLTARRRARFEPGGSSDAVFLATSRPPRRGCSESSRSTALRRARRRPTRGRRRRARVSSRAAPHRRARQRRPAHRAAWLTSRKSAPPRARARGIVLDPALELCTVAVLHARTLAVVVTQHGSRPALPTSPPPIYLPPKTTLPARSTPAQLHR